MGSEYGDTYLTDAGGNVVTKSSFPSTSYTDPDPRIVLTEDVYEDYKLDNESGQTGRRLKWRSGQVIRTSERDAAYSAATFVSVTPDTAAHATATAVVIKGTNLHGVSGVTFGAAAGTSFSVVDDQTINVTTPAQAASGSFDIIIHDDDGDVTATGAWTAT